MKKILIFLTFTVLALLLIHPIYNNDIWMHLKTGENIVKDMHIPRVDDYSYTAQGKEWLNHQWLSQVILFLVYRWGGVNSLIFFHAIVIFSAFLLLFKCVYREENWPISIFSILLVILFCQRRFLVRPLIFSLFLFSFFTFILHSYKYSWPLKKDNLLYILIPFQILWVNLHAASIMGIFLVWSYIAGEFIDNYIRRDFKNEFIIKEVRYRRLLYVGILLIVSTCLTPYGYNVILFPIRKVGEMYFINEWLPSLHGDIFLNRGVMPYYRLFFFISIFVFIFRGRFISSSHLIIFSVLLYLSLSSRRHLTFYGFAIAPCITEHLNKVEFKKIPSYTKKFFLQASIIVLLLYLILLNVDIITGRYHVEKNTKIRVGLGRVGYPDEAVDFLRTSGLEGNMFNDYGSGCFLIWELYPHKKVFLDGRNTIYGDRFIKEDYLDRLGDPTLFEELVDKYGINYIFFHYMLSLENVIKIIPYLYHSENWELVFFDDKACIFARDTEKNKDIIDRFSIDLRERERVIRTSKDIYVYIDRALFYEYIGLLDVAIDTLKYTFNIKDGVGGDVYYNLGTLYLKKEMWIDAVREFKMAIEVNRIDVDAHNNLGIAYAQLGQYKEAIEEFRKVLFLRPFHKEARYNIEAAKKDYEKYRGVQE